MIIDSRKDIHFYFFPFFTLVLYRQENLNNIFVRQILIDCIFSTAPGTFLVFLVFLIIFSEGLSLLLIFSKNKLFFPVDQF